MLIGLPKGLYYYKYHSFIESFLNNLDIPYITSPDTNKHILNKGISNSVDEACLPIKLFHGHIDYLKDKCDFIITPRIMKDRDGEYICPKFCGIIEMIENSISNLPDIISTPLYLNDNKNIYKWCKSIGKTALKKDSDIKRAFHTAKETYNNKLHGINEEKYNYKVALLGHPYNVYDAFSNMDIVKRLHIMDTGVITEEMVSTASKEEVINALVKKPFWTNMINALGAGVYLAQNRLVDGIVFLSSFQCGIDSVSIDLIKDMVSDFPMLVLKLDEHSGYAGTETRIEAFTDMLKRRDTIGNNISTHG